MDEEPLPGSSKGEASIVITMEGQVEVPPPPLPPETDFVFFDSLHSLELRTPEGLEFRLEPLVNTAADTATTAVEEKKDGRETKRKRHPNLRGCSSRAKVSKNSELELYCEWDNCQRMEMDMTLFMKHVEDHISQVGIKYAKKSGEKEADAEEEDAQEEEDRFACLWLSCGYETPCSSEMIRHVHFHTFHTKIKRLGEEILRETGTAPCMLGEDQRNVVPDLGEPFRCLWEGCDKVGEEWAEAQRFYWHVGWHAEEARDDDGRRRANAVRKGNRGRSRVPCQWRECHHLAPDVSKLREHLRSHSQERLVGCPVCGGLFANRVKFFDHCKRQDATSRFRCSYCSKRFAAERLLRDHMRAHINHYKCPLCDMTCPSPSGLNAHMNYRHSVDRPFACQVCGHRSKSLSDLLRHDTSVHKNAGSHVHCPHNDCSYRAQTPRAVQLHVLKHHQLEVKQYCCHLCQNRYQRGEYLTEHLKKAHQIKWPSGHSRFRYRRDDDGMFRLQTVRFEVAEEATATATSAATVIMEGAEEEQDGCEVEEAS